MSETNARTIARVYVNSDGTCFAVDVEDERVPELAGTWAEKCAKIYARVDQHTLFFQAEVRNLLHETWRHETLREILPPIVYHLGSPELITLMEVTIRREGADAPAPDAPAPDAPAPGATAPGATPQA